MNKRFQWAAGYCALPMIAILIALLFLSGCTGIQRNPPIEVWDDMKRQGKFLPQGETKMTDVFPDARESRVPPEGTVSRGNLTENTAYYTGMEGDLYVGRMPVPITPELVKQGQARFNVYCTPCHDRVGTGRGIVPTRVPVWQPSNLTEQRLVDAADGDIFNTITNGRRTMPPYRFQITVADRWAIISYVRVLQRAAHSDIKADVPQERLAELK
jgi:mono/diheme cytochrome c family protein